MPNVANQVVEELFNVEPNAGNQTTLNQPGSTNQVIPNQAIQPTESTQSNISLDVVEEIFNGSTEQSELAPGGIRNELDFEQQQRAQQRFEDGKAPLGRNVGFNASFRAGFVKSPEAKAKEFSKALFPGEKNAIQRFGVSESGDIVYQDQNGELKSVNTVGAGTFSADAPIIAGEVIGGVAGAAVGRPFIGTVAGGTAGTAVKNSIGRIVLGDESIGLDDFLTDAAIELTLGATVVAPAALLTRNARKRSVSDVADFDSQRTKQTIKRFKDKTGIDLDVAQASQLGSLRELRKWASKFPNEAQNVMLAFRELQSQQSQAAVNRIMQSIASGSSSTALGVRGINAAKASIESAKLQRSKITQPLYQQAFNSGESVDINPLFNKIKTIRDSSSGKQKRVLNSLLGDLKKTGTEGLKDNIEDLHNVKLSIDDLLENNFQNAIGSNTQRALADIKTDLVDNLATASGQYDIARQIHGELSQQLVAPLQNSIVGAIANISNKRAATVSAELLTAKNADPQQVRFLRSSLKREDPEAFNGIVRQFIANNVDTALKELQNSGTENVEGKLTQSLFGTPKQKQAMLAALDGNAKVLFKDVMGAFKLIKDAGASGSDTAFNQQQADRIVSAFPSIRRFILQPGKTIVENAEQEFIDRNAVLIARALTDPEKVKELRQLKSISGKTEAGLAILSNIVGQQALEATGREFGLSEPL